MALSTSLKNRLDAALRSVGDAEELVSVADAHTTAIGTMTAADSTKLHAITSTAAELNVLAGVTAGTAAASSGVVLGTLKQVDTIATATDVIGVSATPGAATQSLTIINKKTAIADNTATSIFTVTCPNATHTFAVQVTYLAAVNNAGALDSARIANGYFVFSRVAGAALVGAAVAITDATIATSGSATLTLAHGLAAVSGAVGATNTMDIQVTLVKTGGTNHQIVAVANIINSEATGATIAAV